MTTKYGNYYNKGYQDDGYCDKRYSKIYECFRDVVFRCISNRDLFDNRHALVTKCSNDIFFTFVYNFFLLIKYNILTYLGTYFNRV